MNNQHHMASIVSLTPPCPSGALQPVTRMPWFRGLSRSAWWVVLLIGFPTVPRSSAELPSRVTRDMPPRKVIVGTVQQSFWGTYPGLQKRLEQLGDIVDQMNSSARKQYQRSVDLAVLPETALTDIGAKSVREQSVPFEGKVQTYFAEKARQHGCYIVVPMHLLDDRDRGHCSNAALLVDRTGKLVGTYRKMHVVPNYSGDKVNFEGGLTLGTHAPVFECDFGRVGMQICFDMSFETGWDELARQGADLVVWPTQSPQTGAPAARARKHGFYIVSSTWRNNASIFEPTGKITAQVRPPQSILVQELDLSYVVLPWSSELENGRAFTKRYGNRVGYRYYEDEDLGIFWSNDPHQTIGQMARELGIMPEKEYYKQVRQTYDQARRKHKRSAQP